MNFLKNPASSISNAVEINKLKSKKNELTKEKNENQKLYDRYEEQIKLKENILKIIDANNIVLTNLRTFFINSDIKYDVEFKEFEKVVTDVDLIMYKTLYDKLTNTNECSNNSIKNLDKNVSIDKQIYTQKIEKINEKIEVINAKLSKVRNKQFK